MIPVADFAGLLAGVCVMLTVVSVAGWARVAQLKRDVEEALGDAHDERCHHSQTRMLLLREERRANRLAAQLRRFGFTEEVEE